MDIVLETEPQSVPCIMCWQPSHPEPGADPVCSPRCEANLDGKVAEVVDILITVDRGR